jgi:two-component system, NtrC family, response regulator
LRDRTGDTAILAHSLLEMFNKQFSRNVRGFSEAALAALEAYHWPGNVRELQHKIKRAVVMGSGTLVEPKDLELFGGEIKPRVTTLREARETAERRAVCSALSEAGENVSKAAELLEITRPTLYALLNRFNLRV